jgi:hypothetical protein
MHAPTHVPTHGHCSRWCRRGIFRELLKGALCCITAAFNGRSLRPRRIRTKETIPAASVRCIGWLYRQPDRRRYGRVVGTKITRNGCFGRMRTVLLGPPQPSVFSTRSSVEYCGNWLASTSIGQLTPQPSSMSSSRRVARRSPQPQPAMNSVQPIPVTKIVSVFMATSWAE